MLSSSIPRMRLETQKAALKRLRISKRMDYRDVGFLMFFFGNHLPINKANILEHFTPSVDNNFDEKSEHKSQGQIYRCGIRVIGQFSEESSETIKLLKGDSRYLDNFCCS
jgi:hypothetical protein